MRVSVDQSICVSAGQCVLTAEEVFDQGDDGIVMLLQPNPDPSVSDAARRAASLCPARAIAVSE